MPSTRRTKQIQVGLLSCGNICMGLVNGIIGPTLLDLAEIYGVHLDQVSHLYTSRSVGFLIGSVLESFAVNERNSEIVLIGSIVLEGISMLLYPAVPYLWLAHAAAVVNGAMWVIFESCANVRLANLWEKPTLAMQIFHVGYGFATFVIPFLAEPFLSKTHLFAPGGNPDVGASRISIPYAGIAACCAIVAIGMTIFFCSEASSRKSKSIEKNFAVPETVAEESRESRLKASEILLVILLAVFLLMFECNVMSFTGMITPFVIHSDLHLDKSAGAYLGGVIRSTFFAGLLLLVIAHRIPLWIVLTMSLSTLMLSSTIFAFFVLESPAMIWISAAGIGLGLSALFGTGIVWTCQYVALKHWHMAVSMLSMCIGNLAPAFLVAPWIETHPMVLAYLVLGLSALLCMTFATMLFVVRNKKKLVLE